MQDFDVIVTGRTVEGREVHATVVTKAETPQQAALQVAGLDARSIVFNDLQRAEMVVRLRVLLEPGKPDETIWFPFGLSEPANTDVDSRGLIGVRRDGYGLDMVCLVPGDGWTEHTTLVDLHPAVLPGLVVYADNSDEEFTSVRWGTTGLVVSEDGDPVPH